MLSRICLPAAVLLVASIVNVAWSQPAAQAPAIDDDPTPQLLENIDSPNIKIAAAAARSLGVVFAPGGKGRPEDFDRVTESLVGKLESDQGAKLREESARALGRMKAAKAIDGIKEAIDDRSLEVSIAAAEAAANILPVDQAREFLKERGADGTEHVMAAVYYAMDDIAKAEDVEFLLRGVGYDNWRVQEGAVRGLERAARNGATLTPEDYDLVADVFGVEILNAANQAVHFFTHVRNAESQRALIDAVDTPPTGEAEDVTWRKRAMALRAVHHLGWPSNRPCLPALMRQLGDPTANVSVQARNTLAHLRKENKVHHHHTLYPLLLTELERSVENEGPLYQKAGIMREMGWHVEQQYATRVALASSKVLEESLDAGEQWPAREAALRLIGGSGHTGSVEMVAGCVKDDVSNCRQAAGRALAQLGPLVDEEQRAAVAEILQPLLVDATDWRKTAIAARAAGYYYSPEAIEPLTRLLGHSVVNVKSGASDALVQYAKTKSAERRDAVKEAVFAEVGGSPAAWEYGARVLGPLDDPAAVELLLPILDRGNWRAQANAADAAAALAKHHKLGSKELSDALVLAAQSDVLQVQDAANRALREIKQQ